MRKKIELFEKAVLMEYLVDKGSLPPWDTTGYKTLALLCDITEKEAEKAFERACQAGYLERNKRS